MPTRDTHIAANTLANGVGFAPANFFGQERVGNAGPGSTNEIEYPAFDLRHHGVWRGKSAHANNWAIGHRSDKVDDGFVGAFGSEP